MNQYQEAVLILLQLLEVYDPSSAIAEIQYRYQFSDEELQDVCDSASFGLLAMALK